jgi:hypothetical protein
MRGSSLKLVGNIIIAFILLSFSGCHNDDKKGITNLSYKLSVQASNTSVLINQYSAKRYIKLGGYMGSVTVNSDSLTAKTPRIIIDSSYSKFSKPYDYQNDSVLVDRLSLPGLNFYPTKNVPTQYLTNNRPHFFSFTGLRARDVMITVDSASEVHFTASNINNIIVYSVIQPNLNSDTAAIKMSNGLKLHDDDYSSGLDSLGQAILDTIKGANVFLKNIEVGELQLYKVKKLTLSDCYISGNSKISADMIDTIELDNVTFANSTTVLDLGNILYWYKDPIFLKLNNVEASQLKFNYQYIRYIPDPRSDFQGHYYSEAKQNFTKIIAAQRKSHNDNATIVASTDSIRLENNRYYGGEELNMLEEWWNYFGFFKPQVLVSIAEAFGVVLLINFILFGYLVDAYDMSEFYLARQFTYGQKNYFLKLANRFFLCLFYSGYLFFGLRLEITKLKLNNLFIVGWITIQYLIGIVSLGYIANLVISK